MHTLCMKSKKRTLICKFSFVTKRFRDSQTVGHINISMFRGIEMDLKSPVRGFGFAK